MTLVENDIFEIYNDSGVEPEDTSNITTPFDPALLRITTRPSTIDLLINRMEHGELELAPDFQRLGGIWNSLKMSRLIESLLIRIPLPAFYMFEKNDGKWQVVDGLQRLTTLKRFVVDKDMRLKDLEFLSQLNGMTYPDIPRHFQRRILETQVTLYVIEDGTPEAVKFNVFRRINTGGVSLNMQEIRHALNQGAVTQFLKDLADSEEFKNATNNSIRTTRMEDRECVLRFMAFYMTSYKDYKAEDFDSFLSDAMKRINQLSDSERDSLKSSFIQSMDLAYKIFESSAFRKQRDGRQLPINKSLFESLSVNLSRLNDYRIVKLINNKDEFRCEFYSILDNRDFNEAISSSTGDPSKIRLRFEVIEMILQRYSQ